LRVSPRYLIDIFTYPRRSYPVLPVAGLFTNHQILPISPGQEVSS
jgi:hypothetical protein